MVKYYIYMGMSTWIIFIYSNIYIEIPLFGNGFYSRLHLLYYKNLNFFINLILEKIKYKHL